MKSGIQNLFAEKSVVENVYTLSRMYDYCIEKKRVVFEQPQEKIIFDKPKVIGNYSGELYGGEAEPLNTYISILDDVIVTGGSNLVVTKSKDLLSDEMIDYSTDDFGIKSPHISYHNKNRVIMAYLKKPHTKLKAGIMISCDHDSNYFHWLVECLPKVLFADIFNEYRKIPILIPSGLHENLKSALYRVNLRNHPIICIDPGVAYSVDKLIYPSALSRVVDRYKGKAEFGTDIILSQEWILALRNTILNGVHSEKKTNRKLFLARRGGARALGNQKEIELILTENGFESIDLDDVDLDYQIELFSQASVIVAPTGAALTNMLFCQPGTKVIIFMSNHETTNFYFWSNLGDILGLDVTTIAGDRLFKVTNYYSVHDDYKIDPAIVLDVIKQIEL